MDAAPHEERLTGRSLIGTDEDTDRGTGDGSRFHAVDPASGDELQLAVTAADDAIVWEAGRLAADTFPNDSARRARSGRRSCAASRAGTAPPRWQAAVR